MTASGNRYRHSQAFDGAWIRKASDFENLFQEAHDKGKFQLCYKLHIKSRSPLKEEQVRLALTHLYRKSPCLHFCFGFRDGARWLRRATNPEVDFKVLEGEMVEDVVKSLYLFNYNINEGPLFCARMLLDSTDPAEIHDDLDVSFSHKSCILFGLHHCVGDGMTNTYLMGRFISLLNDVLKNKPICDDEPLGEHIGDEITEAIVEENRQQLKADPALAAKVAQELESFGNHKAYIGHSFRKPDELQETKILEYTLDSDTTERFLQKCRKENITFNSAFSAVVSVALTDLLLKENITRPSFRIQFYTIVNLRRYWETKSRAALGSHIGHPMPTITEVPANLGDDYWKYARSLHGSLWHDLNAKKSLLCQAHSSLQSNETPVSSLIGNNGKICIDFNMTNLGDITQTAFNEESEARITHISRSAAIDDANKGILVIFCHTFRGKFNMTFAYDSSSIGIKVMKRLCEQVVARMQNAHTRDMTSG